MNSKTESAFPETHLDRRRNVLPAVGIIALAALWAYHNSFEVPFLFDDQVTIQANPSIRHLESALSPPNTVFSAGRPLLNLTFALNYAAGRLSVRGYHALNLLIHCLAGITLFGIVKKTLCRPKLKTTYGDVAPLLALAAAAVWMLHPVQAQSVTYISQRAESLMGLWYLLTLYFFIRSTLSPTPGPWVVLSVTACALGMMTKEVMISAPLVVLLYDRTFLAGSFREAWRKRWRTYLGLAATWLLLAALMAGSSLQSRGVGYQGDFTLRTYALTESKVVLDYLALAFWPHPLIFDYGPDWKLTHIWQAAPYLFLLALLVSLTLWALRRHPCLGFLGAWFFLILAPTSSIVPLAGQPMAENRIYLPLAAIVTLAVLGFYALTGRKGLLAFPLLAVICGAATVRHNSDYRDEIAIWSDTISKCPGNSRAHNNLGLALVNLPGRLPDAIAHYEAALKINPDYAGAHNNLGIALARVPGRLPEAIAQIKTALRLSPDYVGAYNNLGNAYVVASDLPDAIANYEAALKIRSDFAEAEDNLGKVLAKVPGRSGEAIAHYEAALKINPDDAEAHYWMGNALAPEHPAEAAIHYEAALRINPDYEGAHNNLGLALVNLPGRLPDAIAQYEAELKINPYDAQAHYNLAYALAQTPGHSAEAIAQLEAVLKIDSTDAEAHYNLGVALLNTGRSNSEAWAHLEAAVRLRPDWKPMVARLRSVQP